MSEEGAKMSEEVEKMSEKYAMMSDRERLLYFFPSHSADDPRIIIVEKMFRSKNWDVPDEFLTLSTPEINCLFLDTLMKIQQDPIFFKGDNRLGDVEEFIAMTRHVKTCIYAIRDAN